MIEPERWRLLAAYFPSSMPVRKFKLTAESVNKLPLVASGQVLYRDVELQGFGLRVGAKVRTYFVEKRVDGRTVRHSLGVHGQITADEARKKARIRLGEMTAGADPNAERREGRRSRVQARVVASQAAQYTVKALCTWYVTHQAEQGKQSAKDAASLFAKYIEPTAFAAIPARELTAKQATAMVRAVVESGHRRTAAKLRSYLRAAYALAQRAETDAEAPAALVLFGVEANPVAATAAIKNSSGARDVTLIDAELGECVRLLRRRRAEKHDDALAAIELSLMLGGQRLAQVLRITDDDVNLQRRTITLLDPKGRREVARRHVLPLTNDAAALVETICKVRRAKWLFGDKSAQTSPDTVSRKGVELLAAVQANIAGRLQVEGKEAPERPKLEARDLRRTAETMLAAMGISKDVRAQLLSHGLGGVQGRHYDQHEYMDEKRKALEAWQAQLNALAEEKTQPSRARRKTRAAR